MDIASDVNQAALAAAAQRMASLTPLDERAVAALVALVATGAEAELYFINPLRLAAEHDLPGAAMVDACVAASRVGLLQFTWTMTCPWCGMYSTLMPRLHEVQPKAYCAVCDQENPAILDRLIHVAFTVSRAVRPLRQLAAGELSPAQRFEMYRNRDAVMVGLIADIARHLIGKAVAPPRATYRCALTELRPDTRLVVISHERALAMAPPPGWAGVRVRLDETGLQLGEYLREAELHFDNQTAEEAVVGLLGPSELFLPARAPEEPQLLCPAVDFRPALNGKMLLCNQAFRDLYAAETLSAGIALQIESLTLLFTDLKGSTALYDAIGDVKAFSLVSEHFKILLAVIKGHQGAVVKTIGDAVMAAFADAGTALQAALAMTASLRRFNAGSGLPPLSLKIGLHSGPCIVVNSNERLDYFGQTVNVAARVQGLADGDEIVISDTTYRRSGVAELLAPPSSDLLPMQVQVHSSLASLKGVGEQLRVHTLRTELRLP